MMRRSNEQGSALLLVLLVILVLLGLGVLALRQSRTQMLTTGNMRVSQQAFQIAESGVVHSAATLQLDPGFFYRSAIQANPVAPTYTFGADQNLSSPAGIFLLTNSLAGDSTADESGTDDVDRMGKFEYMATISRPRLAEAPPGYQKAGGTGNRFMFYVFQLDVTGWVNRDPGTLDVIAGSGGARRQIRADVRFGPLAFTGQ